MTVRVYLPTTLPLLAECLANDLVPSTDDYVLAPDESEEAEYSALMDAADTSALLIAELGPGLRRRVVVVAEVNDVADAVPMGRVVAVHADTQDDADPEDDLAWFATQEIPSLL